MKESGGKSYKFYEEAASGPMGRRVIRSLRWENRHYSEVNQLELFRGRKRIRKTGKMTRRDIRRGKLEGKEDGCEDEDRKRRKM